MNELATVSRNNVENEPCGRPLMSRYFESFIPISCGASVLRYRYQSVWTLLSLSCLSLCEVGGGGSGGGSGNRGELCNVML